MAYVTKSVIPLLTIACTFLIAGCMKQPSLESGPIVLRLAHNQPTGHPYDLGSRRFATGVGEATQGKVIVKIYPSSQLGDSPEQLEGLLLGTLDFSVAATAYASEFVPQFGLFSAPFLFADVEHFGTVFDGVAGKMLDSLAFEQYRIRFIGTLSSGDRIFFNSRRDVGDLADLNGLKVRVMSGKADAMTWGAFGAIPTPMSYSELYSALQAGVIDGAENDPASILANRFYEATPFMTVTNHLVLPMGIFASERTRKRVSPETWEIILQEAREAGAWQRLFMDQRNRDALETMQSEYGVTVSYPDRNTFIERVKTLQDEIAVELQATALLEQIRLANHAL